MHTHTATRLLVDVGVAGGGGGELLNVGHVAVDLLLKVLLVQRSDRAIVEHQLETLLK